MKEECVDDGGLPDVEDLGSDEVGEGQVHPVGELPGAKLHGFKTGPDPLEQRHDLALLGDDEGVEGEDVLQVGHLVAGVHHAGPEGEHRAAV